MNIENYNPKRHPKYGGCIYRFLKKERKLLQSTGKPPRIVRFKYGFGWYVGWFINDGLGDFIGSRIGADGEKVKVFCHIKSPPDNVTQEVSWREYERIGMCALTPFYHDWIYAGKNTRKCRHCAVWQRRRIETVKTVKRKAVWEEVL